MRMPRPASLFAFDRRRLKVFGAILGVIYGLAILGVWVAIYIPFIGGVFFLAGLMVWYLPGILFAWTGLFAYHEFGAAPTGVAGHIVMLLFYATVALIASWPFAPHRAISSAPRG